MKYSNYRLSSQSVSRSRFGRLTNSACDRICMLQYRSRVAGHGSLRHSTSPHLHISRHSTYSHTTAPLHSKSCTCSYININYTWYSPYSVPKNIKEPKRSEAQVKLKLLPVGFSRFASLRSEQKRYKVHKKVLVLCTGTR